MKGSANLGQRMTAVELLPEKIFLGAEEKITVPPQASQNMISGTVEAARLPCELPFRLRQARRLEKQVGLAALNFVNFKSRLAGGSR